MLFQQPQSGPPGLTLRAWARINPTTGAQVAGGGFSGVVRHVPGIYTFTFAAAQADAQYVLDFRCPQAVTQSTASTTAFQVACGGSDPFAFFVAVWS